MEPTLVHVHPTDNGLIRLFEDSGTTQAGKVLAMTIATGPLGLVLYGFTRGLNARCVTCGKIVAKSRFSRDIEKQLSKLVQQGELMLRAYTPPPIAEYDPNEVHAPTPSAVAVQKKEAEDKLYNPVVWSGVLLFVFGGAAIYGLRDHFRPDFSHIAAEVVMFGISGLLFRWLVKSLRPLIAATNAEIDAKRSAYSEARD